MSFINISSILLRANNFFKLKNYHSAQRLTICHVRILNLDLVVFHNRLFSSSVRFFRAALSFSGIFFSNVGNLLTLLDLSESLL